jgi:DNA-binding NtrC family response regulator
MRRLLVSTLRKQHCEVIEVASGSQLWDLALADELCVDLILSDVRMPCRSGLQVLAALRQLGRTTPFILITGFGDRETHAEAHRLGALTVFNKPFELDELRAIIVSLQTDGESDEPRESSETSRQPVALSLESTK